MLMEVIWNVYSVIEFLWLENSIQIEMECQELECVCDKMDIGMFVLLFNY